MSSPTVRMRLLGRMMRDLRIRAGKTQQQVMESLGMAKNTLSRIEGGLHRTKHRDLQALLQLYQVSPDDREEVEALAKRAHEPGWWAKVPYAGSVSSQAFSFYVSLEQEAEEISRVTTSSVSGLLQTADYARAIEVSRHASEGEIDRIIDLRIGRQRHVLDPARNVRIHMIMDEAVLRRRVAPAEVMAAQMDHLVDLASRRDTNVTIQIMPLATGLGWKVVQDFTIFDLGRANLQLVALEGPFGPSHYDLPDQLTWLSVLFGALSEGALSPRASVAMIGAIAKEYHDERSG